MRATRLPLPSDGQRDQFARPVTTPDGRAAPSCTKSFISNPNLEPPPRPFTSALKQQRLCPRERRVHSH